MGTQLLVEALARDAQFEMIDSPSEAAAILDLVEREKPRVVVISAKLGEDHTGGVDLLRQLRSHSPSPRVVMLLDTSEREAVIAAFRAGAQGVFCRPGLGQQQRTAVRARSPDATCARPPEQQWQIVAFSARDRCRSLFGGRPHQPRNRPSSQAHGTHGQELSISYFRQVRCVQPGRSRAFRFGRWRDARSEGFAHH